jgi:hypothetical protein
VARYNKIPRTLWTEGGMLSLEPPPLTDATLYLYLRTCDRPTRIAGLLRGIATICDDTGWSPEGVRKGVRNLSRRGLLTTSERPAYTLVHEALAFDLPTKGNDLKGALSELDELPQCEPVIVARLIIEAGGLEGVPKGVTEGVRKGLRSQEQEQEQEQIPPKVPPGDVLTLVPLEESKPSEEDQVWAHWRKRNPSAFARPGSNQLSTLTARVGDLRSAGSPDPVKALCAYIDWISDSDSPKARSLRDGGHVTFKSIMRPSHVEDRMPLVRDWVKSLSGGGKERLSYQTWSWFEGDLSREADASSLSADEVTTEWASRHSEVRKGAVPDWVIQRAIKAVREERAQ